MKGSVLKNPQPCLSENARSQAFRVLVYKAVRGKTRDFPWRKTKDPYHILVSEIMLQQTQAGPRTISKYDLFIEQFPTIERLAQSRLSQVLKLWQGLGYNRRAKYLRDAARTIVEKHGGKIPRDRDMLEALPGIGPYTVAAVMAFAFNKPVVMIETNIRTVYLYHFFAKSRRKISDREIVRYIVQTMDRKNPRKWYTALMDYGAILKRGGHGGNQKSKHYVKQKTFKGSARELRGKILRELAIKKRTEVALLRTLQDERAKTEIQNLIRDGLVARRGKRYTLAE